MKIPFLAIAILASISELLGQTDSVTQKTNKKLGKVKTVTINPLQFKVEGEDTIAVVNLEKVNILTPRTFKNPRQQRKYNELLWYVKTTYPYAKLAGEKLRYYEGLMKDMSKGERKRMMKKVQEELEEKFGGSLKDLTFRQGKVLLKLIDRETGRTSYELIDDLRGTFQAFFWNGIGSLFGYDLKENYDPENKIIDQYIEEAVQMIEAGIIE